MRPARPGYTPSPELLADGLTEWGMLFDSWSAERTMGFSIPQYVYPVTGPGSQSGGNGYQLGPTAADWVGPRPESIVRANLEMTSMGAQPVYLPIRMLSAEDWASLSIRQIPGINVTNLAYWEPQFPNGVFNVFPPDRQRDRAFHVDGILDAGNPGDKLQRSRRLPGRRGLLARRETLADVHA